MTCMSCTRPAEEADRSLTLAARASDLIRRAWRAYWEWRARKVTILLLKSLDRRTLHDIGIEESEIESLVCASSDRCRRYDSTWFWQVGAR